MASEKRLIDANALIEEANAEGAYGYVDAKQIADAPTVDAILVVRCRDCKRWEPHCNGKAGICEKRKGVARANDFCSYGERKEGADNG